MFKRALMLFVLIVIFGISCGGIYQLTFGSGEITVPAFITKQIEKHEAEKAEKERLLQAKRDREKEVAEKIEAEKQQKAENEKAEQQKAESEAAQTEERATGGGGVTNPKKVCDTPGCTRAVFVEYEGKHLCVKCYAKLKNSENH